VSHIIRSHSNAIGVATIAYRLHYRGNFALIYSVETNSHIYLMSTEMNHALFYFLFILL
jgi:hypothetical protein